MKIHLKVEDTIPNVGVVIVADRSIDSKALAGTKGKVAWVNLINELMKKVADATELERRKRGLTPHPDPTEEVPVEVLRGELGETV